jgi:hypothetical protein
MFKIGSLVDVLNAYRNFAYKLAIHYLNNNNAPENYIQQRKDILKYMNELKGTFQEREELTEYYNGVYEQTLLDLNFANGDHKSISEKIGEIMRHKSLIRDQIKNK